MGIDKPGHRRIRLLLVDDNPAVLRQIAEVLPDDFDVVDMLESGEGLPFAVTTHAPDVIVLDITLPGESGLAVAAELRRRGCTARLVFLTVHQDADYVRSALAVGACGYVVKLRLALDLETAVRAAADGQRFISPLPELSVD